MMDGNGLREVRTQLFERRANNACGQSTGGEVIGEDNRKMVWLTKGLEYKSEELIIDAEDSREAPKTCKQPNRESNV